jgi:predicted ester cyclase
MSEESKALARRSWDVLRSPGLLEEVYTPDLVWHEPDGDIRGYDGAREFLDMWLSAFPDASITVDDVVAEGDKAVTRWRFSGTHRGEFAGLAPTGRQVTGGGITVHRIAGDKIVEEWEAYDNLTILQQLGAVPAQRAAQEALPTGDGPARVAR